MTFKDPFQPPPFSDSVIFKGKIFGPLLSKYEIFSIATSEYPASVVTLNTARMMLFHYKPIIVSASKIGQDLKWSLLLAELFCYAELF